MNRPTDIGGPTNMGITKKTLAEFWEMPVEQISTRDIQRLPRETAIYIYYVLYMKRPRIQEIPDPELREHIFDCAVLHGRHRAVRWLQFFLKIDHDGIIGPITLSAIRSNLIGNSGYSGPISNMIMAHRVKFMAAIVRRNPSQLEYLNGWIHRALTFLR